MAVSSSGHIAGDEIRPDLRDGVEDVKVTELVGAIPKTPESTAPVHVELAVCRCEAMLISRRRHGAVDLRREVRPDLRDGFENVKVV